LSCVVAGQGLAVGRGRLLRARLGAGPTYTGGGDVAETGEMGGCYASGLLAEDLGRLVLDGRKGAEYGTFSSVRHGSSAKTPTVFV
jgi:hypothetical protein